jgi:hypothetical protein
MTAPARHDLQQQADAILKRARCDVITAEKQDRRYLRAKQAASKRLGRHRRAKAKKLGKLGAASTVRIITTVEPETETKKPDVGLAPEAI